jgi:hypothetical protein
MARTTTTKPQAKTKTTKKTAAKRTTAKTTAKSVSKSSKASATKISTKLFIAQTQSIHKLALASFLALAIAAIAWMANDVRAFSLSYMVRDQVTSQLQNATVLAPAMRIVAEVPFKWLLVIFLSVAALFQVLNLSVWRQRYEQEAEAGVNLYRWIEVGVTGALMVEITALLSGITDIMTLKFMAGLIVLSALLGWLADRQNAAGNRVERSAFYLSLAAGALPLVMILVTAVSTWIYGMIRSPWYVYALYAILILGLTDMAVNQWFRYTRRKQWADAAFVERNYMLIGLVTKVLFAGVLIIGLLK